MTTINPEGEQLRKALKWISQQRQDNPAETVSVWIEAACLRFNLSPNEGQYLTRLLATTQKDTDDA